MADFTKLRLRRTALTNDPLTRYIFNTDYTPIVDQNQHIQNATISYAEPWVQSYHKQLWVDNVCINPTLTVSTLSTGANVTLLSIDTTFDVTTHAAQTNIAFNYTSLLSYLDNDFESLYFRYNDGNNNQDTAEVYSPFSPSIITLDDNISFNKNTRTINSDYLYDAHIHTGADIIAEQITFENINNVISNHLYLDFYSEFGKRHGCDVTSLANPSYGSTLELNQSTNVLDLANVNVDEYLFGPIQLNHGQQISIINSITCDEYGRVKGYEVTRYLLPASDGGGGGSSVTQSLSATSGSPIVGTSPTESYTSNISLSDDLTPVVLTGTQPTNGDGTDLRFRTTQDTNEDTILIVVHCIDGGEIQAS